jgi:L-threonylcarbamoyladenylate synthase
MIFVRPAETGGKLALQQASEIIKAGGVVAYPTETFYGLGIRYDDTAAMKRLYELKYRSTDKAMPLIIGDKRLLDLLTLKITDLAEKLIRQFWPGPLTILFSAKEEVASFITAGTGKIAVRIPGESFALEFARELMFPITATSANISGFPPAETAEDVARSFGDRVDLIIDCGKTPGGKPSTIVDASEETIRIIRAGQISSEEIFAAL